MGFKMKSSPYGEKRSGEMDMKPRMSSNFDKSGIKNADGSSKKPGAPGFMDIIKKVADPLGIAKKAKGLFGGKKGGTPPVDPNTAPPADPNAAAAVVPPAGVAPADPTLAAAPVDPNAAPMQMRYKDSPAKGKFTDAIKKGAKKAKTIASKAYDKASQVGMGLKKGISTALEQSKYSDALYSTKAGWAHGKIAYNKEKKADEAAAKNKNKNK